MEYVFDGEDFTGTSQRYQHRSASTSVETGCRPSPHPSRPTTPRIEPTDRARLVRITTVAGSAAETARTTSRSQSRVRPGAYIPDFKSGQLERAPSVTHAIGPGGSRPNTVSESSRTLNSEKSGSIAHVHPWRGDIFPTDELGDEMSEHARVWQVYVEEAIKTDAATVEGWNRAIDVLLVFAGLFSAVLTTFVIQAYALLLPDPADSTNFLLSEMIAQQSNISQGLPYLITPSPPASFPSTKSCWVNGLWFTSLACSLSSALISMVVKQWLQWLQSTAPTVSGTPRDRARLRQYRHMSLEMWHVPELISALPLILHIALLLFFAGLIVLLWSLDIAITAATVVIVVVAYLFYIVSTVLPLFFPSCPYQTPIALHFAQLLGLPRCMLHRGSSYFSSTRGQKLQGISNKYQTLSSPSEEDALDAQCLCWLLGTSADSTVITTALQALAGLPRDFTATQILRDAGASQLIEQGFMSCFQRDRTIGADWRPTDLAGAELFCRAWLNVMRDTGVQWPLDLVDTLWALQGSKPESDPAVIASCAVALSSFDSLASQWELLAHLGRMSTGEVILAPSTQRWLIDSISECSVKWEMPAAILEQTAIRAVPALLRVLHSTRDYSLSEVRHASALALRLITCGPIPVHEFLTYHSEDRRREDFCCMTLHALTAVVECPDRFALSGFHLDVLVTDFARLASLVVAESERFPRGLRIIARRSLSRLFLERKLSTETSTEPMLSDVMQLLFPPRDIPEADHCRFVGRVVEVLNSSTHSGVLSWSIRLLEELFRSCTMSACKTFASADGISAVLRVCKIEDPAVHRLQVDSLRALFILAHRCTAEYSAEDNNGLLDLIFESAFLDTFCRVVASRRWLFEVSSHWIPILLRLCQIRPRESIWKTMIETLGDFVERNMQSEGYLEASKGLEVMRKLTDMS